MLFHLFIAIFAYHFGLSKMPAAVECNNQQAGSVFHMIYDRCVLNCALTDTKRTKGFLSNYGGRVQCAIEKNTAMFEPQAVNKDNWSCTGW